MKIRCVMRLNIGMLAYVKKKNLEDYKYETKRDLKKWLEWNNRMVTLTCENIQPITDKSEPCFPSVTYFPLVRWNCMTNGYMGGSRYLLMMTVS